METPPTGILLDLPPWVVPFVDWATPRATTDDRVRLATDLARQNVLHATGGPFGAAVFERDTGRLVAVGVNGVLRLRNSAMHAEVLALALAERRVGSHTLAGAGLPAHELVSSCEPCIMCTGALLWSGVRRLVFAASREDARSLGFEEGPSDPGSLPYLESRGIEVLPGVLAPEGRAALDLYRRIGGPIYNG